MSGRWFMKSCLALLVTTAVSLPAASCEDPERATQGSDSRAEDAESQIVAREIVRIGTKDGPAGTTFGEVSATTLDRDGNIYVLDGPSAVVRMFDANGHQLRDLGRRGAGPGELRNPNGLLLDERGQIWIFDWRAQRYTAFLADGQLVGTYRRGFAAGWGTQWDAVAATDGRIREATTVRNGETLEIQPVFLLLDAADGLMQAIDTIPRPPALEARTWSVGTTATSDIAAEQGGIIRVPYQPERQTRLDPRGGYWVGRTDSLLFVRYADDGSVVGRIERTANATPVERGDRAQVIEDLRDRFGSAFRPDPDDIPAYFPLWTDFFVDEIGRLWLHRFTRPAREASSVWEIHDSNGALIGHVRLPLLAAPRPSVRGDHVVGVVEDELGVDYVVVYEVSLGESRTR
jgi:hypothetical protein